MSGTPDGTRAVFVSLLVVLSVVTGTMALAGTTSAAANNLKIVSSQPVKGDGALTVSLTVNTTGANASFKVQGANGTISEVRTVTDNGPADQDGAGGAITTTLDLGSMFDTAPASGTAVVYAAQNNPSFSISGQTFDTKRQVSVDSTPPSVRITGGSSSLPRSPAYGSSGTQVQITYTITDTPQKIQNGTMTIIGPNGNVLKTITGLQAGNDQSAQFVIPSDWSTGEYTVVLTAVDEVGYRTTDRYEGGLIVDNSQPAIDTVRTGAEPDGSTATNKLLVEMKEVALDNESVDVKDFNVTGYDETAINVTAAGIVITIANNSTQVDSLESEGGTVLGRGETPAVKLNDSAVIKDQAGNTLSGPKLLGEAMDGLRPRAPNETSVEGGPITDLSSVTVTAHFFKRNESRENRTLVPVSPEGGTVYVRFTGPTGVTVIRSMPAETTDANSTGTFDLTGTRLRDGEVKVETKMVDDSVNTWESLRGYTARTFVTIDTPDTVAPVFSNRTPAPGSSVGPVSSTATTEVGVTLGDYESGVDERTIAIYVDDGDGDTTWDVRGIGTAHENVSYLNGSLSYTPGSLQAGDVTVKVVAADGAGNRNNTTWSFTLESSDTSAPRFGDFRPAANDTVSAPLDTVGLDIGDTSGVDERTIAVSVDDGDSDTTWDLQGVGTSNASVTFRNGSLTVDLPSSTDPGEVTVKVVAADVHGNRGSTTWSFTLSAQDTTAPSFAARTPAPGSTVGAPLEQFSVAIADQVSGTVSAQGSGVNESSIAVSVDDGDADSTWDVRGVGTGDARVSWSNGTLAFTPGAALEAGNVTVRVVAADDAGNRASTTWSFRVREIDQVTLAGIEHDFVGVVREPDGTVSVTATASSNGTTIASTSGGQFSLTLLRNGTQVPGTKTITADASGGVIGFDLTRAINGTPVAGQVTVRVAATSASAADNGSVVLTHKVVAFGEKWDLVGTPMPVEHLYTSGVANFYGYSPGQGYTSSPSVTEAGTGYYAERRDGASTARIGYTFETTGTSTLRNTTLETGWNLLGPAFDIDAKDSVDISKDLAPAQFSDAGVVVYADRSGDLVQVTDPDARIGEFTGYFVYVDADRTRVVAVETYEPTQD